MTPHTSQGSKTQELRPLGLLPNLSCSRGDSRRSPENTKCSGFILPSPTTPKLPAGLVSSSPQEASGTELTL